MAYVLRRARSLASFSVSLPSLSASRRATTPGNHFDFFTCVRRGGEDRERHRRERRSRVCRCNVTLSENSSTVAPRPAFLNAVLAVDSRKLSVGVSLRR